MSKVKKHPLKKTNKEPQSVKPTSAKSVPRKSAQGIPKKPTKKSEVQEVKFFGKLFKSKDEREQEVKPNQVIKSKSLVSGPPLDKRYNNDGTMKLKASDKDKIFDQQMQRGKSKSIKSTKKNALSNTKDLDDNSNIDSQKVQLALNKRIKEKQKRSQWLAWKMYSYRIFNALLRGKIDKRNPNLNSDSIQIGYSEVFTKKIVSRYIVLSYFPEELHAGFLNDIIKQLKTQDYWTSLTVSYKNKRYVTEFDSTTMISRLTNWNNRLKNVQVDKVVVDGEEFTHDISADTDRRRIGRMIRSYYKLRRNVGNTFESTVILKLDAYEKDELLSASDIVTSMLSSMKVSHYIVKSTLLDFMRAFSTVSQKKTVSTETTNRILMTTRDIINTLPYQQGKVGDKGIWFGSDIFSGANVWLDIMTTPKAKNIIVLGETGSGKTFYVSMLLFFHRALNQNIFIHDHKGNEFTAFARAGKGLVISMTPSESSYIMTWAIQYEDLEDESEIEDAYSSSFAIAEVEFLTLTEPDPKDIKDYKNIFSDFHRFVHQIKEIRMDMIETYSFSHEITPQFLYDTFLQFMNSPDIKKAYSSKILMDIQIALHRYWSKDGARNILYRRPINITEIKRSKIVCFDFGMAKKTREAVPQNEEKLKKIFMNASSSIYINHKKKLGEYTVKVVEEIQSADEDILKFTAQDISEGRAKNMINYVLGNASGTLEKDNEHAKAIVQNMNIRIIGKLAKSAREFFIKEYGLEQMEDDLKLIARGDKKYNYAFLLNCQITNPPATAIVRAVATKEVEMSKFFKTVDYDQHEVEI